MNFPGIQLRLHSSLKMVVREKYYFLLEDKERSQWHWAVGNFILSVLFNTRFSDRGQTWWVSMSACCVSTESFMCIWWTGAEQFKLACFSALKEKRWGKGMRHCFCCGGFFWSKTVFLCSEWCLEINRRPGWTSSLSTGQNQRCIQVFLIDSLRQTFPGICSPMA